MAAPEKPAPSKPPDSTAGCLHALAEAPAALFILDRQGQVRYENRAAQTLRGAMLFADLPLVRGAALAQLLQAKSWDCVELAPRPEDLGRTPPVALVFELTSNPAQSSAGLLLVIIPVQSAELSSLAEREEFLATAAHDLKNPLSAIFGYADALLETKMVDPIPERPRTILGKIRATAARAVELVRNYQHLAELAAQKLRYSGVPTDLNFVARSVVEEAFREDPGAHTVQILPSPTPALACIDRLPIERAVTNLFLNACRYTPRGGTISIICATSDSKASLAVHNTGSVIPAAELSHIFHRRFRGSTSTGTSGSGLGLYIAKGIIEQAGGDLAVESSAAHGTKFTISLPLKSA